MRSQVSDSTDTSVIQAVTPWDHEQPEKSAAERYRVSVQVGILAPDGQNQGDVRDISISGARIEHVEDPPPTGTTLRLGFSFFAHALPVPIRARVVRHTDSGGFAVKFEDVDFRTQILLRALLPKVSCEERPHSERIRLSPNGLIDAELPLVLFEACAKLADSRGLPLDEWVTEQLERAVLDQS